MKRLSAFLLIFAMSITVGLYGCEKKAKEVPQPVQQPAVTPPPAPAPTPIAPAAPAPAPTPAPEPAKPAKK
ncbi:MAG TPA: hypothetical protein VLG39_04215 [Nitrospirota bacterium]|nr:hypothetical protein [Nitrospirota bacterium]